jgi:transmembrane sensor
MQNGLNAPAAPMAGGQPIAESVADEAAEWLTLLMSGEASDDDHRRWQAWRAAHPDHERAWRHIEAVTQRFKALTRHAGYQALSPYLDGKPGQGQGPRRRKALKLLLWGGVTGTAGLLASRTSTWRQQVADHRTGTGEQRTVTLADGSQLTLGTASAIDVRFDSERRLLRLVAGEVLVTTAHALGKPPDPRPLIVETAQGGIRALGTRFGVRQHGGHTGVAVLESAVEITPADGGTPRIVKAGERTSFTRDAVDAPEVLAERDTAWARGQIIADDMPLGDFLAELARYRPGIVRCDPAVAGLRLSGVFPLHDTDRILATLPNVVPVQVRQHTRWWVVVEAAP